MGSDQLLQGTEGSDGLNGLDVTTSELPVHLPPRPPVLAGDGPRRGGSTDSAVSIRLETDELPFQRPNPHTVPLDPATRNWRVAVADAGKWTFAALGVAVVLVAVFAAFISRNGQSLSDDSGATEAPSVVESASTAATADRSTGTLVPGENSGFFSGQIVEPDRSLTGTDVDWTPATVATTPSTAAPSTTAAETTVASSSTTTSQTTTSQTTTLSTTTTAASSVPWVRALGPGSASEQNPVVVGAGRVTLEAEGSNEGMRYRFFVSVKTDDGEWRQVERSRWRRNPSWKIDVGRYDGRVVRWTVVGVTGFRNMTDESGPLYFLVGGGDGGGDTETEG